MAQDENKTVQHAIQKLVAPLREDVLLEVEGPSVYYLAVKGYGEFYVVGRAPPIISDAAKSYRPDWMETWM